MASSILNNSPKLSVLINTSKEIKNEIKSVESLSEAEFLEFASRIEKMRQDLDLYETKNYRKLFQRDKLESYATCQNNINKAQSILLKKSLVILEQNDLSKLYERITEIWKKNTSGKMDDPEFGKRLLEKKKKDPILLSAVSAHLRCGKMENGISNCERISKPHVHHVVCLDYWQIYQDLQGDGYKEFFVESLEKVMQEVLGEKYDKRMAQDFAIQKIDHPFVVQTVYAIFLKIAWMPLQKNLNEGRLDKVEKTFEAMPEGLKNLIAFRIGACLVPSGKTDDEVLKIGRDYIKKKLYKQDSKQALQQALELEIKAFNERIEEAKISDSRKDLSLENGLFFQIQTIVDAIPQANSSLDINLQLAYEALSYAIRKIRYSSNFLDRENTQLNLTNLSSGELANIKQLMIDSRRNVFSSKFLEKHLRINGVLDNSFSSAPAAAKIGEGVPLGNCGELSDMAFAYLIKQKNNAALNIDIFRILGNRGDHVYIIIGIIDGAEPMDHRIWGPDAVVCDPWARKIYPAHLIEHLLFDYAGRTIDGRPELRKFDPTKQFLQLKTSRLLSMKQFRESPTLAQLPHAAKVEEFLKEFHEQQDHNGKKIIAAKILSLLTPNLPEKSEESLLTLIVAQMNYFLFSRAAGAKPVKNK